MKHVGEIKLEQLPLHDIVIVATSDPDYEMDRVILVEDWEGGYLLVTGGHCSCYGFDEAQWDATAYDEEELRKVAQGWQESGYGAEVIAAPLILAYIKRYGE